MSMRERPLSPHLQIYRWQITMLSSILHRATGIVLSLGALALACWLALLAGDAEGFAAFNAALATVPGRIVLVAFSAALIYHLLNGLRHLAWDAGWGYELPRMQATGYATFVLTVVLTAVLWGVVLGGGAA